MTLLTTGSDQRCTRGHRRQCLMSASHPKHCKCTCGGRNHGTGRVEEGLLRWVKDTEVDPILQGDPDMKLSPKQFTVLNRLETKKEPENQPLQRETQTVDALLVRKFIRETKTQFVITALGRKALLAAKETNRKVAAARRRASRIKPNPVQEASS